GDGGTKGSISGDIVTGSEGTLAFDRSDEIEFGGNITGGGTLVQNGQGTLVLTGKNSHSGGTVIRHGSLQIGEGHDRGTLTGLVESGVGTKLVFNRADQVEFSGTLKGQGQLVQKGGGITILTGDNTYTGGTKIESGTLQLGNGGTTGNLAKSDTLNNGTLMLNLNGTHNFDGVISGSGRINKIGTGVTTLNSDSSAFTGSTYVEGGTFAVDGKLGTTASTLNVKNGGAVNGSGIIGGTTTIESGGHLAGIQGDTLTFGHDLIFSPGANVDISFGGKNAPAPALFDVHGDLTLAGTLKVTDLGGFSVGEYDIFNYGGTLKDNGMTLSGGEPGSLTLNTHRANKVYLINTGGMLLNYWDGGDPSKYNNSVIDGGDGVWRVGGSNSWTSKIGSPNSSWKNTDQFAIFAGTAGTVQIDNSGGNVTVNGMQFSTDGYKITGNALTLENDSTGSAKIRVGTGNKSKEGWVATIESDLTGSATLETTDYG
ncbi:autotransporter-associated beta strand repeat-containing protein, partial [Xenorhabdus sp. 18]|uniref:autotransporter-associated beta strand repeat-containing protein n=1 Tax=Xenorhabdus doucetiae TaxID=351671 RepID=UPI0019CC2BC6